MNDSIRHLPGIASSRVRTARLETQVLTSGPEDGEPVLFLHGNLSSSTFWEETMLALPARFRALAPDQRCYGLSDPAATIDATRGFDDWADDVAALADHFGWERFHLIAHSLGGCIGWALMGLRPERLTSVTLVAPGPPSGFPGGKGERGEPTCLDGAGSGAGLTHPKFLEKLRAQDRSESDPLFSPRVLMNRIYWKAPFRPAREEELLTSMLQVHVAERRFPGDWTQSPNWPGFAPGKFGAINAISPLYNQHVLPRLLAAKPKPPLLWIYGGDDAIISDGSYTDPGYQGQRGQRPGWPGQEVFPPQPLLTEVKHALDEYERGGGKVTRLVLDGVGHTPYLERPAEVQSAIADHLASAKRSVH